MDKLIPFNVPYVPEVSKKYVLEALESNHQQGDGPFTAKASKIISGLVGGGHVLLTPSCTHALEMASMLANIGPGDEVILPSYTFTSAATAVTKFGAKPVFVDIEMETKGIDVNQVRDAITPRTRAISWVNYAGVPPDIEGLQSLAKEFNLLLIEDNAHGLGGSYKGKPLGSFGDFATQSFHATKNIQCGEGGALVINNPRFIERAEIVREKGTNRSQFLLGQVEKYQWVDHGSSYLLPETLSGILLGQLQNFANIQINREKAWHAYENGLSNIDTRAKFKIAAPASSVVSHMFYLETEEKHLAESISRMLRNKDIHANFHYQPLGNSIAGLMFGRKSKGTPVSEKTASTLVRLPLWFGISETEIRAVIENLIRIVNHEIE
jgi:dTDP-4-amino-4,6-dideoxygalactose transaminase